MKIIALVGGVGIGKTYYGEKICAGLQSCQFIEEDTTENLYINEFYHDMKKWGFHSRISMLSMIVSNLQKMNKDYDYIIFDRCVQELIVFARKEYEEGNMTEKEFALYSQLYKGIVHIAAEPDLYLYFYCKPQTALERIQNRGRECEKGVDLAFCEDVISRYNDWRKGLSNNKVIDINTELDINLQDLITEIKERLHQL